MAEKTRGRPALAPGLRRSYPLHTRVRLAEAAVLESVAGEAGLTLGEYVRQAALALPALARLTGTRVADLLERARKEDSRGT